MNYELAKQLKDAGFPQESNIICYFRNPITGEEGGGCYAESTLSELIEACGNSGETIKLQINPDGYTTAKNLSGDEGYGKNPEEAVANLWLELNKKD